MPLFIAPMGKYYTCVQGIGMQNKSHFVKISLDMGGGIV
jgi:hypothetical protein